MTQARSNLQSARFHAICRAVSQQATFGGRRLSEQQWKVVFVSGLMIVEGERPDLLRGIEDEFVLVEKTSRMSSERMAALIDYVSCWAAQNNVELLQ